MRKSEPDDRTLAEAGPAENAVDGRLNAPPWSQRRRRRSRCRSRAYRRRAHGDRLRVAAEDEPDLAGGLGVAAGDLQRLAAQALGQARRRRVEDRRRRREDCVLVADGVRVPVDADGALHRAVDRRMRNRRRARGRRSRRRRNRAGQHAGDLDRVLDVAARRDRLRVVVHREPDPLRLPPVGGRRSSASAPARARSRRPASCRS